MAGSLASSGYAGDRGDRKSTLGYCTYVGGNLVTWRSKKQNVVSKSNAEVEYRFMSQTTCEMMWLKSLLIEFGFSMDALMAMHCDNEAVIFIVNNLAFHEHIKHIEVDCHYVRDTVTRGVISTSYTQSLE